VTDSDGVEISRHTYYPFGYEVGAATSGEKQFTGHERDSPTLDYMHARYYNPTWGRFLSVDPLLDVKRSTREPQSWNRYSYVVNNPINRIDPDGRMDGNGMGEPAEWRCPGCTRAEQLEQSNEIAAGTAKGAAVSLSLMAGGAGVYAFATNAAFRFNVLLGAMGLGGAMVDGFPATKAVFRGGQSLVAAANEVKIVGGLVQPTHGVSVNAVASQVQKFGGAYRVTSIPDGLQVIQRGKNANHYEIVAKKAMTMEEYQKLLSQVKVEAVR
ncbi:MAG: RHS repeat-associated core domain-containing protein, partial [Acidobacteriota bacterium]|nr:RHS repeat-associated core domain-containing protein [Acidobacteriota bacterium]